MNKKIIIAVDGHASCGKSTLAKELAKKLGYIYLDSGAMYRSVTLYFLKNGVDWQDTTAVEKALSNITITFRFNESLGFSEAYLNGKNVEKAIRSKAVSGKVSEVSAIAKVRAFLVEQQRALGKNKGICMDGRDIGTIVFPGAELKLFMTASIEIRAMRRFMEMQSKGIAMTLEEVKTNLQHRDHIDSTRKVSPLKQAKDAIVIDNSYLSRAEQLDKALQLAAEKINKVN